MSRMRGGVLMLVVAAVVCFPASGCSSSPSTSGAGPAPGGNSSTAQIVQPTTQVTTTGTSTSPSAGAPAGDATDPCANRKFNGIMEALVCINDELNRQFTAGEISDKPVVETVDVNGVDGKDGLDIYVDGKLKYRFNTASQSPAWTLVYAAPAQVATATPPSSTFLETEVIDYLNNNGFSNVQGDGAEHWQVTADCGTAKENAVHVYWIIVSGGPNAGLVFSGNAYSGSRIANHGPTGRYDLAGKASLRDIGVCVPAGH